MGVDLDVLWCALLYAISCMRGDSGSCLQCMMTLGVHPCVWISLCIDMSYNLAMCCFLRVQASDLISNGSEMLLLVPAYRGIVGSVVLPVLGAVPDGAIILFSGLGSDAKEQIVVGVGALAGSTIMLITVPWFIAVVAGKVWTTSQPARKLL